MAVYRGMTATNLAELYDLPTLELATVTEGLGNALSQEPESGGPNRHTCWLTTLNADGGPHVTGIGALWVDDTFWFTTRRTSRKGRNLDRDPRCVVATSTLAADLVLEGRAALVTDRLLVAARAAEWAAGGWPCEVDESGLALTAPYSAPSAGPPPWHVYRIEPTSITALGMKEPGGATRWRY